MGSATSTQAATSGHIAAFVISQGGAEYEAYRQCLIDSGITGAQLLAAKNSTELDKMLADINIENEEHRKFISKLLRKSALPPIRLIDFDSFVAHAEFPRFPDQENLVTTLDDIDRNNSLIVFVSHCYPGADGYELRPHPDNKSGEKFKLCVSGIKKLHQGTAKSMKKCYLWLDFCCIDQSPGSACGELKMLKEIIECCDCLFTPIYDDSPDWKYGGFVSNYYEQYQAKLWNVGDHSYLNRGWCRVEMFYAANIPIMPNSDGVERHSLFSAGLAFHCEANRRPHFLYGNHEMQDVLEGSGGHDPVLLPPLQNAYFSEFDPRKGCLSVASDMANIIMLVEELEPYMSRVEESYVGEKNDKGENHGHGVQTWDNGSIYDGEWVNGVSEGHGKLTYDNGDIYVGEWKNDLQHGRGISKTANGSAYNGEWENGRKHGHGVFTFADGNVYEGEWKEDLKHGHGTFHFANGDVFCGEYRKNMYDGRGVFTFSSGANYNGEWKEDQQHGHGVFIDDDGNFYDGEWRADLKHGHGTYHFANGDEALSGLWCDNEFVEED